MVFFEELKCVIILAVCIDVCRRMIIFGKKKQTIMKTNLCLLLLFIASVCCTNKAGNANLLALRQIESQIQDNPVESYNELVKYDKTSLSKREDIALYSLLMSMAMDKNYIDIGNDSIISPAVGYYSRTRDKYHKFLSYYYLGRVNENAELFDKAIASYIEASKIPERYIPNDYLIRLHTRKATVYYHQFALDKALEEYCHAKEKSTAADNPAFFIHCSLDVATTLESMGRHKQAFDELESLKKWTTQKSLRIPKNYYHLWLRLLLNNPTADKKEIESAFRDYEAYCKLNGTEINHLIAADYYLAVDDPQKSVKELEVVNTATLKTFSYVQYYASLASAEKRLLNYREALEAHELYTEKLNRMNLSIHNNDVRYLEERSQAELDKTKAKLRLIVLLIFIVITISVAISSITYLIIKKKSLNRELENAKAEYGFLKEVAKAGHDYPEDIQKTINERIIALKSYIYTSKPLPIIEGRKLKEMNDKRNGVPRKTWT